MVSDARDVVAIWRQTAIPVAWGSMPDSEPRKVNVPKVVITILIAVGIAVCFAVVPGKEQAADSSCDDRGAARRAWFATTPSDGRAPRDEGYDIVGKCDVELLHREFSCEESSVRRINSDNPYMKEALALGFTTYICESPNDSRVNYPIQRILGP
jgi:hypothetical protein